MKLGKIHTHSFFFLPTNDPKAARCDPPICAACGRSRMTARSTKVKRSQPLPEKFMNLKQDDLLPGDVVSLDQYQSSIKCNVTISYFTCYFTINTRVLINRALRIYILIYVTVDSKLYVLTVCFRIYRIVSYVFPSYFAILIIFSNQVIFSSRS